MPTRHLRDDGALLQALHDDPGLDLRWPTPASPNARDYLDPLNRFGLSVKRTVDLCVKSLPPHEAESLAQKRAAGYVGTDDRLQYFGPCLVPLIDELGFVAPRGGPAF